MPSANGNIPVADHGRHTCAVKCLPQRYGTDVSFLPFGSADLIVAWRTSMADEPCYQRKTVKSTELQQSHVLNPGGGADPRIGERGQQPRICDRTARLGAGRGRFDAPLVPGCHQQRDRRGKDGDPFIGWGLGTATAPLRRDRHQALIDSARGNTHDGYDEYVRGAPQTGPRDGIIGANAPVSETTVENHTDLTAAELAPVYEELTGVDPVSRIGRMCCPMVWPRACHAVTAPKR